MRWADALQASKTGQAKRQLKNADEWDGDEPNLILKDPKFPKAPKLFRAVDSVAWKRLKLRLADNYDDWMPVNEPS